MNISCAQRGNCARYLMVWGQRQSVSSFPTKEVCGYQMPLIIENIINVQPFKIQSLALADTAVRGFEADSIMSRFNEDK